MVQHFLRRAVQFPQPLDKFRFRQIMGGRFLIIELRCTSPGNKEMRRQRTLCATQPASELETDQRSHAMTEEREWFVEKRNECWSKHFDHVRQVLERRFREAFATPRRLHCRYVYRVWQ